MIKRFLVCILVMATSNAIYAQSDTIRNSITPTVDQIYKSVMPLLQRIEITGNSATSIELRTRWNNVVNYLQNNKGVLAEQVKDLMISPSGKEINLDLVRQFIDINTKDSVTKISINPDFWMDELQALSKRITDAAVKMTDKK